MTIGPIIAGLAMVWLTRVGAGRTYLGDVVAPMLLFGLGLSFTVAPLTSTVLASAPDHQAGIASAINNDVARVAGLLAVAVLPALAGITPAAYADPATALGRISPGRPDRRIPLCRRRSARVLTIGTRCRDLEAAGCPGPRTGPTPNRRPAAER